MTPSPESSGGAGFSTEDSVVATYLVGLLVGGGARGLREHVIKRVLVQRAEVGHPLDDLIVEGEDRFGQTGRGSFQVKQALTVSDAASNSDFREIVQRCWQTLEASSFTAQRDRIGVATSNIAVASFRDVRATCEWARMSATADDFFNRIETPNFASQGQRGFVTAVRSITTELIGTRVDDQLWRFLQHFVLLRFDIRAEGAEDDLVAVDRLRSIIQDDPDRATELWTELLVLARDMAGTAASFDRASLLARLSPRFSLAAAPRFRRDLLKLAEEAEHSLSHIRTTVGGYTLTRQALLAEAREKGTTHRLLHIVGEPGNGKSVVLRLLADEHRTQGFALVLRADRLVGPGWAALATHLRLQTDRLADLLVEVAASGDPVLYLDGLDRVVAPAHRETVLDLVKAIINDPRLRPWRIVATLRDSNIQHVRTWFPEQLLLGAGVGTLTVPALTDEEALYLGQAHPPLRLLLFGGAAIREISRRPFFLRILATGDEPEAVEPRTEVELAEQWWRRGGYDADTAVARRRQVVLRALADRGCRTLGRGISTDGLVSDDVHALVDDGIIRDDEGGGRVTFEHDIFFEWSFFQVCSSRGDQWLSAIVEAGEIPQLGRVVELLSQARFERRDRWADHLRIVESAAARSQWNRAWLLAPFSSPLFPERENTFADAIDNGPPVRFSQLLVWFQAVRTTEHPGVLSGEIGGPTLTRLQRLRLADSLSWPRDMPAWRRLTRWVIDRIGRLSGDAIPDVLTVFDVWLNAFPGRTDPITQSIRGLAKEWLAEIESVSHPETFLRIRPVTRWEGMTLLSPEELESTLRAAFLRTAICVPALIRDYLMSVAARPRVRHHVLDQLLMWSPRFAEVCPGALVDLCLAEFLEPLPSKTAENVRGHRIGAWSPHSSEWHSPSIKDHLTGFRPASPTRQPFHSLFQSAPREALRLVQGICRHMMTAWRELHRYDWHHREIPLAIRLEFPWGVEEYWGNRQVYLWYRGAFASGVIASALMALEDWAFREIESGRPLDDVIRDVVAENTSSAVLGIAVALVIEKQQLTPTTLPLVTCQRLWAADMHRRFQIDNRGLMANEIGAISPFGGGASQLQELKRINARPVRQGDIRQLAMLFALLPPSDLQEAFVAGLRDFPNQLPFEYEQEQHDHEHLKSLREMAETWAAMAERSNYEITQRDQEGVYVAFADPSVDAERKVEDARNHLADMNRVLGPHMWVTACLERRSLEGTTASDSIVTAQALDSPDLFDQDVRELDYMHTSRCVAVAGTAAVVLEFAETLSHEELAWATAILERAARTPSPTHSPWSLGADSREHPAAFAALGFAALVRRHSGGRVAQTHLLALMAHPVRAVAATAIREALHCWKSDDRFGWIALDLGLRLSVGHRRSSAPPAMIDDDLDADFDDATVEHDDERLPELLVERAVQFLHDNRSRIELPRIPKPWGAEPVAVDASNASASGSPRTVAREPDEYLRCDIAETVLRGIPLEVVLADSPMREAVLGLAESFTQWTVERLAPSWQTADRRSDRPKTPYEWVSAFSRWLAQLSARLETCVAERLLAPLWTMPPRARVEFLKTYVGLHMCVAIIDPPVIEPSAIDTLSLCLDHILDHPGWRDIRRNSTESLDAGLREIVYDLLAINWTDPAPGATRFANGKWTDVRLLHPLAAKLLVNVGDVPTVLAAYLRHVELGFESYEMTTFVSLILGVPPAIWSRRSAWAGNTNAAQIASLIQLFAERDYPLTPSLRADVLTILDRLIDVGNRRSAGLQISDLFKSAA
jgi:hypothetical protein